MLQWEEINTYGPLCARYALTPDIISHVFTVRESKIQREVKPVCLSFLSQISYLF